jgi:hypothetical protein
MGMASGMMGMGMGGGVPAVSSGESYGSSPPNGDGSERGTGGLATVNPADQNPPVRVAQYSIGALPDA